MLLRGISLCFVALSGGTLGTLCIFLTVFLSARAATVLSIWNLTHTICAMGAMAVFLKNKPLESLNRDNVHQRCQHGLSLLNLYRDDKTKLLYHIHHEKNTVKGGYKTVHYD